MVLENKATFVIPITDELFRTCGAIDDAFALFFFKDYGAMYARLGSAYVFRDAFQKWGCEKLSVPFG